MDAARTISVRLADRSGLDDVRKAAWVAHHRSLGLEIIVDYRPPSLAELVRWRAAAPPELRWRVTGSVCADELAAEADAVAKHEGVAPDIRMEEQQQPRHCRVRHLRRRRRFPAG